MTQGSMYFLVNGGVGFIERAATLGVTKLDQGGAGFSQHGGGYFTGPGAVFRFMHILRAGQTGDLMLL